MNVQCDAYKEGIRCETSRTEGTSYCHLHHIQERALYQFYKDHEKGFELLEYSVPFRKGGHRSLEAAHRYLSLAVRARTLHTKLFYTYDHCDGHDARIKELIDRREEVKYDGENSGFNVRFHNGDRQITARLINALYVFSIDDAIDIKLGDLVGEMPTMQILSDEPVTVSRYADDRDIMVYYPPVIVPDDFW